MMRLPDSPTAAILLKFPAMALQDTGISMTEWFYRSRLLLAAGLLTAPFAVAAEVLYQVGLRDQLDGALLLTLSNDLRYPAALCILAGALKFLGAMFHHERSV
jgi:hypothetical protein